MKDGKQLSWESVTWEYEVHANGGLPLVREKTRMVRVVVPTVLRRRQESPDDSVYQRREGARVKENRSVEKNIPAGTSANGMSSPNSVPAEVGTMGKVYMTDFGSK